MFSLNSHCPSGAPARLTAPGSSSGLAAAPACSLRAVVLSSPCPGEGGGVAGVMRLAVGSVSRRMGGLGLTPWFLSG